MAKKTVVRPPRTPIKKTTRLYLYVRAGGRCEFDGCNKYLLEHPVTNTPGNFAEMAHIYAFSRGGPRGRGGLSKKELNDLSNLVLLCPDCHKQIDENEDEYTVEVVQEHKRAHEERIHMLTETAPDRQTTAVVLKANIGQQPVAFTRPQMQVAVATNYINWRDAVEVDLTQVPDQGTSEILATATATIRDRVRERYGREYPNAVTHVSVFALGPIPLLVYLGTQLSDKIPTDLYQRHRDESAGWKWSSEGIPVRYETRRLRAGSDVTRVALLLSLSGTVTLESLPPEIDDSYSVYEITLVGQEPNPRFLNLRQDLVAFQAEYERCRRTLTRSHPDLKELVLFPAVPAPVAVACGRDLLPRVDPVLHVYNKEREGYMPAIKVNMDDTD